MDECVQFISRLLTGDEEMAGLCREYGVSRKIGYKWLGRYRRDGVAGLEEGRHAPLRHGRARDVAMVQAVLGLRECWPR
jgi:transposase